MNKLVYTVFKAIMMSILFVFIFDMVFYMYRVTSLNSRMESISTSLKKVVMDNNYLPSEQAKMYQALIAQMVCDYNGLTYTTGMSGSDFYNSSIDDNFIAGFHWNYTTDATNLGLDSIVATRRQYVSSSWQNKNIQILNKKMGVPGDYGDVCVVQLKVAVFQPMWGWTASGTAAGVTGKYNDGGLTNANGIANRWSRSAEFRTHEFVYTYYVPCLNYKTISQ